MVVHGCYNYTSTADIFIIAMNSASLLYDGDGTATAIKFIQREHERVLHGLHMEIERLQQKCSELQFALAYQTASAETEADLRSMVVGLQEESDLNKDLVLNLQSELEKTQRKVVELEEQLKWQELDSQNQLNIKEAKIVELKKALNLNDATQEQHQQVLHSNNADSKMPAKPSLMPLTSHQHKPVLEGNKVFKHQLLRNKSLNSCHNLFEESRRPHQPWSVSPKFVAVAKGSLPFDFKATVATLPPIEVNRSTHTSRRREVNLQSLAVDSGFFRLKRSKSQSDTASLKA